MAFWNRNKKYVEQEFNWDAYWADIRCDVDFKKRLKKHKRSEYMTAKQSAQKVEVIERNNNDGE